MTTSLHRHSKRCTKCGKPYIAQLKYSKMCDDCKTGIHAKKGKLRNRRKGRC